MPRVDELMGKQLRALRKRRAKTQKDLADRLTELGLPFHQTTVARLEAGKRVVSVEDVLAVSAALNVPPTQLFAFAYLEPGAKITVTPKFELTPGGMRNWLRGNAPGIPGQDVTVQAKPVVAKLADVMDRLVLPQALLDVLPASEQRAAQLGVRHMVVLAEEASDAAVDGDDERLDVALEELRAEVDRQRRRVRRRTQRRGRNGG